MFKDLKTKRLGPPLKLFCGSAPMCEMMSPVDTAAAGVDSDVPHGPHGPGGLVSVRHHHPRLKDML